MISPTYIRDYCISKFKGRYRLGSGETELIAESPFLPKNQDPKQHFSLNLNTGLWQCFKTGKSGNFIYLFAYLEGISYEKAYKEILYKELELESEFSNPVINRVTKVLVNPPRLESYSPSATLPNIQTDTWIGISPACVLKSQEPIVEQAWVFLYSRHLFDLSLDELHQTQFYVGISGMFENRVIIPFKENGVIFFYQGRSLTDSKVKYMSPTFPKSSEVLYPFNEKEDYVVVCEGPLDARSLQLQGVNATSVQTSKISFEQWKRLREFGGKIILGFDADEAGRQGIRKAVNASKRFLIPSVWMVEPPDRCKDWNKAHALGKNLRKHVESNSRPIDLSYEIQEILTQL